MSTATVGLDAVLMRLVELERREEFTTSELLSLRSQVERLEEQNEGLQRTVGALQSQFFVDRMNGVLSTVPRENPNEKSCNLLCRLQDLADDMSHMKKTCVRVVGNTQTVRTLWRQVP